MMATVYACTSGIWLTYCNVHIVVRTALCSNFDITASHGSNYLKINFNDLSVNFPHSNKIVTVVIVTTLTRVLTHFIVNYTYAMYLF